MHTSWSGVVEDLRRALAPKGRQQLNQYVAEGLRLIERAVRAGCAPKRVVISQRLFRNRDARLSKLLNELSECGCEVHPVPEGIALELAEGRKGGLLFGLCAVPEAPSLSELCAQDSGPLLVLVDVEEPGNVGALVRTALASGARGLIAVGVSDPFHPKAVRTSMGSLFKLPIVRVSTAQEVVAHLPAQDCVGAVPEGGEPPWKLSLAGNKAMFVGRESEGLPSALVDALGARVSIPMPGGVDSFSVNAAAAILLYESRRQMSEQR